MREIDHVLGAVAAVGRIDAAAIMDTAINADDAVRRLAVYGVAGRRDEAVLVLAVLVAADFLAPPAVLRAGFAAVRRAVPLVPLVAARAGLAAARGFRAVFPLAFCAASSGNASASVIWSGSAALGSEAISPLWLT
jgi:hypothetical protein